MQYRNHDLALNKFFLHQDLNKIVTEISSLKDSQLDRRIYFRPSNCPLVNVADSNEGSCFENYTIPTGSYIFDKDSTLHPNKLDKNLDLESYVDFIYSKIQQNVKKVFESDKEILLCYSGGIDSLVVLSYIINLGFLSRIKFVVFDNKLSNESLYYNLEQSSLTKKLIELFDIKCDRLELTQDYLLTCINDLSMEHVKMFSTSCLFNNYTDKIFLTGHHGNQSLIHKYVFWDEIKLQRPSARAEITNYLESHDKFYTTSLKSVADRTPVPIEQVQMLQKPWHWFVGTNGNQLATPLADDEIFHMLRSIAFKDVSVDVVADALVAREIISRNVGLTLDPYIVEESLNDGDSLACIEPLPVDKINPALFDIPTNLTHSPEGLEWLNYEINTAKNSGHIAFNTVVSLKTIQWLSQL
jgi:hypothetical protein